MQFVFSNLHQESDIWFCLIVGHVFLSLVLFDCWTFFLSNLLKLGHSFCQNWWSFWSNSEIRSTLLEVQSFCLVWRCGQLMSNILTNQEQHASVKIQDNNTLLCPGTIGEFPFRRLGSVVHGYPSTSTGAFPLGRLSCILGYFPFGRRHKTTRYTTTTECAWHFELVSAETLI